MPAWRVLIVEDDQTVATIHKKLIEREPGFEVTGIAASGQEALHELAIHPPDLILLDLSLRGMNGVTLLRKLRGAGSPVEVIAVTASSEAGIVRTLIHLGVVDYLVKPFTVERFRQGLSHFRTRMKGLPDEELTQDEVDELSAGGRLRRRWLPKGLSEANLDRVRVALNAGGPELAADQVAETIGMARVTTRRYLEYLVATDQALVTTTAGGVGRPRKRYRLLQ